VTLARTDLQVMKRIGIIKTAATAFLAGTILQRQEKRTFAHNRPESDSFRGKSPKGGSVAYQLAADEDPPPSLHVH
jgi:hypothetical protein